MKRVFTICVFLLLSCYCSFSQNVGVGTNTPAFKLDVKNGSINTDSLYRIGTIPVLATPGIGNLFVGRQAGIANTTGYGNVALGKDALINSTSGYHIIATGDSAMLGSDHTSENIAIGHLSLYGSNFTSFNVALGNTALYNNTSGFSNTAIGHEALNSTSGSQNVGVGTSTLAVNSGDENVAVGYMSLSGSDGSQNIGVGSHSNVESGNHCTVLGTNASAAATFGVSYATAIGAFAVANCNNCIVLGGHDATSRTRVGININAPLTDLHLIQQSDNSADKTRGIRIQRANGNQWRTLIDPSNNYIFEYNNNLYSYIEPVGGAFVNPSDERLKTDITSLSGVLDKLLLLQPKSYHYIASSDANRYSYGFLAQDVEKLFPDFVFSSEDGIKGIAYHNFSVIAIKAIQEQQELINQLQKRNQDLEQQFQQQINILTQRIEALEKKSQ